jgi:branched-chain amino acid transport system substrate-binding protein
MTYLTRRTILAAAPSALVSVALPARAAKQYGPGVTDTEIKIGNTSPYSGPLSNATPIPLSTEAYFKMINAQGGVTGTRSPGFPTMTPTRRRRRSR